MVVTVGEHHELCLNGWAIAWSRALDLTVEKGRIGNVVVPRNEPFVADCAQQCAVAQIVAQAVLFAHSHDVIEYLNFLSLPSSLDSP